MALALMPRHLAAGLLGMVAMLLVSGCASLPSSVDDRPSSSEQSLTIPDRLREAGTAMRDGRMEEAARRYREVLAVEPEHAEAMLGLATVESGMRRWGLAEPLYSRLIKRDERHVDALEGRGLCLIRLRNPAAAKVDLEQAVSIDPTRWRAWQGLGLVADLARDGAAAEAAYRKALGIMPAHPGLLNNLGYSLILSRRFDEAERVLREGVRYAPTDARLQGNLAMAVAWQGRYEEALKLLPAETDGEVASAHNDIGYIAMQRNDLPSAIRLFEKALKVSPTYHVRAAENLERARGLLRVTPAAN